MAPPPVSTMPLSTMSAAISGGVRSSTMRTASMMVMMGSRRASRISSSLISMVLGKPAMRSRPFTGMVRGGSPWGRRSPARS